MKLALIHIIDDAGPIDPGYGNRPGYGGGRPDNSLPDGGRDSIWGRPGVDHPGNRPIYHPGHPSHGLPSGGHPGNQLPWTPGHPDNSLPVPPGITPPEVPADLAGKLIVLWRMPNTVEWHGKAIDPSLSPDQGLPPAPEPKY